ncbi:hypothetical protein [Nostoc sp.]|uniref:hypothetical protein n=1 Tax=Nostoc sp. TaxID=1180 RepID=UPI002FFA38B2
MHQNHWLDQTREAINFLQEKATECDAFIYRERWQPLSYLAESARAIVTNLSSG